MMKNVFSRVIAKGGYDLTTMLERIDEYHISGKLTDADREELIAQARGDAAPVLDIPGEIQRLCRAVRDLQTAMEDVAKRLNALDGASKDDAADGDVIEIDDYSQPTGAHDAYFAGDVVRYAGVIYECIAPVGAACVWSPVEMPDYWRAVDVDA